jgi:cell wall-associated NlpC family hydrolase
MPGRGPSAAPTPAHPASPTAHETKGADTYALVGTALELRGVPYRNGGGDRTGFDCSGFTQYVFAQHGFALPREVRDQFRLGRAIKADELSPGDLIFFSTTAPGASHVAIAVGGDEFVHAPSSTGVVRVERLSSRYWGPRVLAIRRVTAN